MKINQGQAINIVNNLKGLIYNDIFILDSDGLALASNKVIIDDKYIQYGKAVVRDNKILVVNEENLNHKCIVIPVNLDDELVAIIGLSGDFENVSQYGEIIVKVTEILLRESIHYERKIKSRENNRFLMNELFSDTIDHHSVASKAKLLGYDIESFKVLSIVEIPYSDKRLMTYEDIVDCIESCLKSNDLVGIYETNIIILLSDDETLSIKKRLKTIKDYLDKKLFTPITIGISNRIVYVGDVKMAYYQSLKLLQIPAIKSSDGIFDFEDYALELVFFGITPQISNSFIKNIFGNLSRKEMDEISELLEVYMNNNGSINQTSKLLFIHKNTLQYRLNKIRDKTGYNPRDLKQLFKLYTALTFYYLRD
jgi:carbohydrate diacid regulator